MSSVAGQWAMGIAAAFAVGYAIYKKHEENMIKQASDATAAWESTKTSLEEYISKYQELKDQLDSGNLSEAETIDVKKQILDIQSQITEQYGDQVSGIDLVNGKLETQLNILRNISSEEAQTNLNNAREGYDRAKRQMTKERTYKIAPEIMKNAVISEDLIEIANKYENLFVDDGGNTILIEFKGDATQAKEVINDFMTDVESLKDQYGKDDLAINAILDSAGKALSENKEKVLDKYEDSYKSYLEQSLYAQGDASKLFDYAQAVDDYNSAILSGDTLKIEEARNAFNEATIAKDEFLSDDSNAQYTDMFDEVTEQLDEIAIKRIDFEEAMSGSVRDDNQFKNYAEDIKNCTDDIKEFDLNSTEALEALQSHGSDAYESIWDLAEAWGIVKDDCTQDELNLFIEALEATGVVSEDTTNSLDHLSTAIEKVKSQGSMFDQLEGDLDSRKMLDAIEKADETINAGEDYLKADKYLDEAKEMYDKGLIGTDDFKARAAYFSPTGSDDPANFIENYEKASKYMTENAKGVVNFLTDLEKKGYATSKTLADGTKQWSYEIEDFEAAAQDMGMGTEWFLDMFGRLEDYGFSNNFATSVADAAEQIVDKSADLVKAKAKLAEMESTGFYTTLDENGNEVKTAANQTAITAQREEIALLENDLRQLQALKEEYARRDAESYAEQVKNARETYQTLAEERKRIIEEDAYGADTDTVAKLMEEQMKKIASDNMLEIDAELNLVNEEEVKKEIENDIVSDVNVGISDYTSVVEFGTYLSQLSDTYSPTIICDIENEEQINNVITRLNQIPDNTDANLVFNVENEEQADALSEKIENFKNESGKTFTYAVNVVGNVDGAENTTATVTADVVGAEDVKNLTDLIKSVPDKEAQIEATVSGLHNVTTLIDKIKLLPYKKTTILEVIEQKKTKATGTMISPARASGTAYNVLNMIPAYANGKVALSKDETALVNELGTESIIRDGRWFLIPGGMHTENLKKGDIVLSAGQTKQLMNYGKANGHGHAYAYGSISNAYPGGSGGGAFGTGGSGKNSGATSSSNKSSSSNSNSDSDSKSDEKLDWIEILLSRIQRIISNLDKTVSAAYKSWSKRNTALEKEIAKVNEEISWQKKGYDRYIQEANSVGLDEGYAKLVRDGKIDIETIADEDLREKISEYQQWYEKALECEDAIIDLQDTLASLARQEFDNVIQEFEDQLSSIEHQKNMIEGAIDQVETKGHIVSKSFYEYLIKQEKSNLSTLNNELNALTEAFDKALKTGNIEEYSEEWYDMKSNINDVEQAIQESSTAIIEFKNNIRDLEWELFDKMQEIKSRIQEESDFFIDLMSEDKMYDNVASMTEQAQATMGLHAVNYNAYMSQADDYAKEIEEINKDLANDPYNQDLLERRNELIDSQRDMISSAEDEKQSIKSLIEDGYDALLDYMDELIDKRKEMLKSAKDLFDYEKNIAEQTKEIASLEKQLSVYGGDDSEENRATVQKLKVSLEEARENLEQTEYDRFISDQEQMYDKIASETEEWINERLDNFDELLGGVFTSVNENAEGIKATLSEEADKVGLKLSEEMDSIWSTNGEFTSVVTAYGDGFNTALTTTNNTLSNIEKHIAEMVKSADEEAKDNSTPPVVEAPTAPATPAPSQSSNNNSSNTSSNSSSSSSSSSKGGFFVSKKDSYPKSKLDINTAIQDRLKYHDFDSSFAMRAKYYEGMGLGSASSYKGSSSQNKAMINWMKQNGYSQGGTIGGLVRSSGEDGFVLAKTGEEILSLEKINALREAFIKMNPLVDTLKAINVPNLNNISRFGNVSNDVDLSITLPNVTNYDEFVSSMQSDPRFEKIVKQMTIGAITGQNSLAKYRF